MRLDAWFLPRDVTTDVDGHFSLEGLVPGIEYSIFTVAAAGDPKPGLRVGEAHILEPGEVKVLGDVREFGP
jgi:hypothetical protein